MEKILADILEMKEVRGVLLFSVEGEVLFHQFNRNVPARLADPEHWSRMAKTLSEIREVELIYDSLRIYIRKSNPGFFTVFLDQNASMAMLRLNCDLAVPALQQIEPKRGLWKLGKGIFRKKS